MKGASVESCRGRVANVKMGEPGSPIPPPAGRCGHSPRAGGWGNRVATRPRPAGAWGNPVSPHPRPRQGVGGHSPRAGVGKPGFPIPPPAGGSGRAQPARRGMGQPGCPTPPPAGRCGHSPRAGEWGNRVSPFPHPREGLGGRSPRAGGWGHRVAPRPRPAGGWGNRGSPFPHPREGLGGRSPPRNNLLFIPLVRGVAAWGLTKNLEFEACPEDVEDEDLTCFQDLRGLHERWPSHVRGSRRRSDGCRAE